MGHGYYSSAAHAALLADRASSADSEVFAQRTTHALMDPRGLTVRESRDNADHPQSLAIAFALDVTGSMGEIPRMLARRELPTFMQVLNNAGVVDPQVLFMAIGDANSDHAPLQVGQFESTAELMDQWLTWSFLEGAGGGTGEESYELAFYVAAEHMDTDCLAKRRKKGYLFLTGDEKPYPAVSRRQVQALLGDTLDEDIPTEEVVAAAAESFHCFFLIPDARRRRGCEDRWRELLGDHVICLESPEDTCTVAAGIVALTERAVPSLEALAALMGQHGASRERVGAAVRALEGYAELIDPSRPRRAPPAASAPRSSWWRKLFG